MVSGKERGILLDVDYVTERGKSVVRLFLKTPKGRKILKDMNFSPYFYVIVKNAGQDKGVLEKHVFNEGIRAEKVEVVKKNRAENVLKLTFATTEHLIKARETVQDIPCVIEKREYDMPFANRYIIDKGLEPMNGVEVELEGDDEVKSVKKVEEDGEYNIGSFDLETYSPGRFSDPSKDPIIMASYAGAGALKMNSEVFTTKKIPAEFVKTFETEAEMLKVFVERMQKDLLDIIVTYNGDSFDFPYIKERAEKLGIGLPLSWDGSAPKGRKRGLDTAVKLKGVQHLDSYQLLRILSRLGVVGLVKYDLESVLLSLYGTEKEKIKADDIFEIWEKGSGKELARLASYNKEDAEGALKIFMDYFPLAVELCKLAKLTLYDVNRTSASQLVERLLAEKCHATKMLIPNRPGESTIKQRMLQTFTGGFVKEPVAGLHERIAVLDFSSLHPTIIISHNISPETLDCSHAECRKNVAPTKHHFCRKSEGFLSSILKELFDRRMETKKEMKKIRKDGEQYRLLNARQHALKIILNSFYGYLGYARSRWYSRECASAVTAWSKHYVQLVGSEADKAGFKTIYSDTDSAFLIMPKDKKEEDVKEFVKKINKNLPGIMNLELEGFFRRGIFVTRREGGAAAKKRYALIDYKGNLKIVGFEYVRRDWAGVAKETQKKVIEAVLSEGNPEKAVEIVRKVIKDLKNGKVQKKDLTVITQIKRPLDKYESIGPHVAAANRAVKRGKQLGVGSVISYIITRSGKSISDRAELEEYVKEGNYDADYYIGHQVIPAVIRILQELGYEKEDLIQGGKQHTLGAFV